MTQLPTEVIVGRFIYRVTQDADEWTERGTTDRMVEATTYGATNHHKLLILINPAQLPRQKADTLLHEVLHCVWAISSLPFVKELADDVDYEEMTIGHVTPWLVLVFNENPDLYAYITDPE